MKSFNIKNTLILLLTATIWGIAFVAQSVGMEYVGPFTFTATRSIIGGLVLIPFIVLTSKNQNSSKNNATPNNKLLILGGVCCGVFLCIASNFQQIGIKYTTVGRAGFITACYIIIVPIISFIFLKKKCDFKLWIAVILSLIGLYLLCITDGLTVGKGDILVFICAIFFSLHILVIDYFSPKVDCVKMSCIQFFVCGILSAIPAFVTESIKLSQLLDAWAPILYAGVLSSGIAYTLQIVGQKNMNPTIASLILSLESCISVIAGFLILNQTLSSREVFGCIFMFGAIILAQLPSKSNN
ncbi:MAG: DMT family transporter [Lachnospiraceae bacterium]|nr:DMT family transporter [Lachnospiraceae bacterium]